MNDVKTCTKCNQAKPLEDFPKGKRMKDGRKNQCKQCVYAARRVYFTSDRVAAYNKAYFSTEKGKLRRAIGNKKWRQSAKGKAYDKRQDVAAYRAEKCRLHRLRNPDKTAAREAVKQAWRRGDIPHPSQLSCRFCGNRASEYDHHMGYDPENHLNVIPLCRECHMGRHWDGAYTRQDPA